MRTMRPATLRIRNRKPFRFVGRGGGVGGSVPPLGARSPKSRRQTQSPPSNGASLFASRILAQNWRNQKCNLDGGEIVPMLGGPSSQVSETAEMCAALRAVDTLFPEGQRTVSDPFAKYFLQNWKYRTLFGRAPASLTVATARLYNKFFAGYTAGVILRYRHYEGVLIDEVNAGCNQIVILGAGYDSTALRYDLGDDVIIYEVDKPSLQTQKRELMCHYSLQPRQEVVYVGCDFDAGGGFAANLVNQGFDPNRRSLISWLGVSYYLAPEGVVDVLKALTTLCTLSSSILVDYVESSVVDGTTRYRAARRGARFAKRRGEPFKFGVDHEAAASFFGSNAFDIADQYRISELAELYVDLNHFWLTIHDFMGLVRLRRHSAI